MVHECASHNPFNGILKVVLLLRFEYWMFSWFGTV